MLSKFFPNVTNLDFDFKKWLFIGIALEVIIFGYSYFTFMGEPNEIFRHAARYSGRLSLYVYLFAFSIFALIFHDERPGGMAAVKQVVTIFCVLHFIHFGFLATNVLLNDIELVPFKVAGGFLGYLMILLYPILMDRIKNKKLHFIYFLYLGIVIIGTYMARIKGEFPGVTPGPVHYFGVITTVLALFIFGFMIFGARPQVQGKEV
ncbi:hypothetical protein [Neolewinella persica]|uniref:hypothetical protein n=1 Tax=Neolewinella persica TaxID=70998 RepID=UPI00035DC42A|nr:hypothetical protein [Neolewinella persica]